MFQNRSKSYLSLQRTYEWILKKAGEYKTPGWHKSGSYAFIKQLPEPGLPLKWWFISYRNNHAGVDKDGEVVQVANAEDAIFLPAGKWDLVVRAVCSMWGNCLDPIRRLEMIGFIDRPVPWLSRRLSERRATLLSGPHCSLLPKTLR